MANPRQSNATDLNDSKTISPADCFDRFHDGIDNGDFTILTEVSYVLAVIFNSITCPFTILLNALTITAMIKKTSLQSNPNILLACLAATDLLCGLAGQPTFILWKTFQLNGIHNNCMVRQIHNWVFALLSLQSVLHVSLVTGERLIAIKFSLRYVGIVNSKNILAAVMISWLFGLFVQAGVIMSSDSAVSQYFGFLIASALIICILFIISSYAIIFPEIIRHHKMIKEQQQSRYELERRNREDKALRTTLLVNGALLLSFTPMALTLLFKPKTGYDGIHDLLLPWARTAAMLNSLLNPLIYCWRQDPLRAFFFSTLPCTNVSNA